MEAPSLPVMCNVEARPVTTVDDIVAAIEKAGFGAIPPEEGFDGEDAEQKARDAEIKDQTRKFVVGVFFAAGAVFFVEAPRRARAAARVDDDPVRWVALSVDLTVFFFVVPEAASPEPARRPRPGRRPADPRGLWRRHLGSGPGR